MYKISEIERKDPNNDPMLLPDRVKISDANSFLSEKQQKITKDLRRLMLVSSFYLKCIKVWRSMI